MLHRLLDTLPLARYRVEGESMTPALEPETRVLVNRAVYWLRPPKPGDLVLLHDPRERERLLVKRIERPAGDDAWLVSGDNPPASTDSRTFGPVGRELIVGKVWLQY